MTGNEEEEEEEELNCGHEDDGLLK